LQLTVTRAAKLLTAVLVLQTALYYVIARDEALPASEPLSQIPAQFDDWQLLQEGVLEQRIRDVLRADELLSRTYRTPESPVPVSLFIAYFRSQRTGQAPHSPKNCLPGSGWVPAAAGEVSIPIPGRARPIRVNRYRVEKGDEKSIVLYWYQSRDRVIASEYLAKIYLVLDAMRYRRSDTALVRVVVPVIANDTKVATATGVRFIRSFYPQLTRLTQFRSSGQSARPGSPRSP